MNAAQKLYSMFIRHCNDTYNKTQIIPQIIVTDHVDNLELSGCNGSSCFENLVNGRRWRNTESGLIQLNLLTQDSNADDWVSGIRT